MISNFQSIYINLFNLLYVLFYKNKNQTSNVNIRLSISVLKQKLF